MTQSATEPATGRADKRALTARRIVTCAQELALEHGIDGFTMEQLAGRADVSRRTLFNYFPSKDDAVLGGPPVIDDELLSTFAAGGPTGGLVDDLAAIVVGMLGRSAHTSDDIRADIVRSRAVMHANPRLIGFAQGQLQTVVESCMPMIAAREGRHFDRARVDVAIAVVLACCHVALDRFLASDAEDDLAAVFTHTLATARTLLG